MRRLEGKVVTITRERYGGGFDCYSVQEDKYDYIWHACCFKPIKLSKQELVNDLLNGKISYEEYVEYAQ